MGSQWERIASPPEEGAPLYMDAVLKPHRSLSLPAFKLMLIAVIAVNVAVAAYFMWHGAYPVVGFLGLDVLAIYLAFRLNYRAARAEERVQVGREHMHVAHIDPKGAAKHWRASPLWARVSQDTAGVVIRSGGGWLRVASFLSPDERADFAKALDAALWRAKRGG